MSTDSPHRFGDSSAAQQRFLSLFLRSEREIFRYVAALVPNVADTEDIVQQTALVLHLAQGSKPATARDLIEAGLFRTDAAHSTVHSAMLTLRRRLDELEPELGAGFVQASARGYSLVRV